MSTMMDAVNRRTQLAGHNRMELLMFRLASDRQRYGINVFKVQEVIQCPPLTQMPRAHPIVRGIASIRGRTIAVIDLAKAIGREPLTDIENAFVIVTEYNNNVQGYLVKGVDRIVNLEWEQILPPPKGMGADCYLTAVTRVDDEFVELIDVEKILEEITNSAEHLAQTGGPEHGELNMEGRFVFVADDSSVARRQIGRSLAQIGIEAVMVEDGREALRRLQEWAEKEPERLRQMVMLISDIEMPEMDGYTLVAEMRKDPNLRHLFVLLHSSLSGGFNQAMVERVGANLFIAKYDPDLLAQSVIEQITAGADRAASAA